MTYIIRTSTFWREIRATQEEEATEKNRVGATEPGAAGELSTSLGRTGKSSEEWGAKGERRNGWWLGDDADVVRIRSAVGI